MLYGSIQWIIERIRDSVSWLASLTLNLGSSAHPVHVPVLYFLISLVILGVVIKNIIFKADV